MRRLLLIDRRMLQIMCNYANEDITILYKINYNLRMYPGHSIAWRDIGLVFFN